MTEAAIEERQLLKAMRWYDGFILAMAIPGALFAGLGYTIASVGAWGALALWAASCFIGVLQNWIYAETAAMFPDKPGGIALYAHEGWRRYFSLIGPIATFGYWFAWSSVLAIFGETIGYLVQAEWAPGQTWTFDAGFVDVGLPHVIAAGCVILRLALQRVRHQARRLGWLCDQLPSADSDHRVHDLPVHHRGLGQLEIDMGVRGAMEGMEARDRVDVHHRLDGVRDRDCHQFRARIS